MDDQRDYAEENYNRHLCPLCDQSPCRGGQGKGTCRDYDHAGEVEYWHGTAPFVRPASDRVLTDTEHAHVCRVCEQSVPCDQDERTDMWNGTCDTCP